MFRCLRGEVLEIEFNVCWGEHQESGNDIFGDCHCGLVESVVIYGHALANTLTDWTSPVRQCVTDCQIRTSNTICIVERNGSGVELRTLDYENPGSNPGCGVKT